MDDVQKFMQRNKRRIMAFGGLIFSLVALSLLLNSGPQTSLWMVNGSIPSGAKIDAADLTLVKANLTNDSSHYESQSDRIIGQYATRLLGSGDLLSVTDISSSPGENVSEYLPVGIAVDDLPLDLTAGDEVEIYVIPKDPSIAPSLVVHRVTVENVDQKSRDLGGSVTVSLIVSSHDASAVVGAEAIGRLVIARDSF